MLIEELKNNSHLLSYYRVNSTPVGVVLALKDNKTNTVKFGWSKCGMNKVGNLKDKFSKERGQLIAYHRAVNSGLKKVPSEMQSFVEAFILSAKEHFTPKMPKFEDQITLSEKVTDAKP